MAGYITSCFADWQSETFQRGVMRIRNGKRTDDIYKKPLTPDMIEGAHWYRKADPDFDQMTYSRCHKGLRQSLHPGDTLFFRTLWRERPYIIGYFTIAKIQGPAESPIAVADRHSSPLIHFRLPVSERLVRELNPRAFPRRQCHFNRWANARLGRNYLILEDKREEYLKKLIDSLATSV